DAYLKGNEAYSGNAQNIPEPPPICYPRIELKAAAVAQPLDQGPARRGAPTENSYRMEIPVPPSPPDPSPQQVLKPQSATSINNESVRTPTVPLNPVESGSRLTLTEPCHRTEGNRYSSPPDRLRPLIPSVPGIGQLQYTCPSIASRPGTVYPETSSASVRAPLAATSTDTFSTTTSPTTNHCSPSPPATTISPHQNIDWRNYTTYKDYIDAKRLHTYGSRTIQERLDSLRAATGSNSAYTQQRTPLPCGNQKGASGSQVRRRSASNDRRADPAATAPLRSASQERLGGPPERTSRNWPRSASQDALPFSSTVRVIKPRARSCDHIGQQLGERSVVGFGDKVEERQETRALPPLNRSLTGPEQEERLSNLPLSTPDVTKGTTDSALTARTDGLIIRPSRLPVKSSLSDFSPTSSSIKTTEPLRDQRANTMGNHLSYSSPLNLQLRGRTDSLKMENRLESGLAARSSSCSRASSRLPTHRPVKSEVVTISSTAAVAQKPNVKETSALERTNGGLSEGVEGPDATVVVLRRDKTSGVACARPPSYVLAVSDKQKELTHKSPPLMKAGSADGTMCWVSNESCREMHLRRLGDTRHKSGSSNLDDSLDSIPFIGKAASISFTTSSGEKYLSLKSLFPSPQDKIGIIVSK
ncbi:hypothetical protein XENOCAPTIV_018654, partial [Xenoophorus captivus]